MTWVEWSCREVDDGDADVEVWLQQTGTLFSLLLFAFLLLYFFLLCFPTFFSSSLCFLFLSFSSFFFSCNLGGFEEVGV